MSVGRSRADLLKFLDWMAEKGLLPANTAQSRKASSNKILALLSEEEAMDVTQVDVDDLALRFGTKFGQQYDPKSVLTYKSRLRSALEDFRAYCDNPVGFRPTGRVQQRPKLTKESVASKTSVTDGAEQRSAPTVVQSPVSVVPVAIRADVIVHIGNLPHDLTEIEARRIANVILAYAIPSD
ncbi:hypothetical protein [Hephaestia mangrovi]|uniref:hypothetical protein n=1 Tax=Hephaestia mangrovi TaxID=2873268 RepID=UPI001CA601F6|nr:hypothetical protein [Hephaestia mangrovi]MBY8826684.1 hypothetical protein [Hephaestia mangrovi]